MSYRLSKYKKDNPREISQPEIFNPVRETCWCASLLHQLRLFLSYDWGLDAPLGLRFYAPKLPKELRLQYKFCGSCCILFSGQRLRSSLNLGQTKSTCAMVCSPRRHSHLPSPIPGTFVRWRKLRSPICPVRSCAITDEIGLGSLAWMSKVFLDGRFAIRKSARPAIASSQIHSHWS
jgi:hypothetical protein